MKRNNDKYRKDVERLRRFDRKLFSYFEKTELGRKISTGSAVGLIVSFFLPWILVSCGSSKTEASGADIAKGMRIPTGISYRYIEGFPILYLIPLTGILVIYYYYRQSKKDTPSIFRYIRSSITIAPLLAVGYTFWKLYDNYIRLLEGYNFEVGFGFWIAVISWFGIDIGLGIDKKVQNNIENKISQEP